MVLSDEDSMSDIESTGPQSLHIESPPRAPSTETEPMEDIEPDSPPEYTPATPEYSPASPDYSPPPPIPPRPALRPRGPRMKFTARKTTGIFPRRPLAPRDIGPLPSSTFHIGESSSAAAQENPPPHCTYQIGGPSSATAFGGPPHYGTYHRGEPFSSAIHGDMPYGYLSSRTSIDMGSQQRLMERLEQTEAQLTRTVSVTHQLGQEVVRLRKEVRALKSSKGLISRIWSWFRKGT